MYQCYLHFNTTDLPGQELEMGPVMLQLMNGDHVLLVEPVILPECMFWNDASQSAINVNICGQLHSRYTLYFKQRIIIISKDQMGENDGILYRRGAIVVIDVNPEDFEQVTFSQIDQIYIVNHCVLLEIKIMEAIFQDHAPAFFCCM